MLVYKREVDIVAFLTFSFHLFARLPLLTRCPRLLASSSVVFQLMVALSVLLHQLSSTVPRSK